MRLQNAGLVNALIEARNQGVSQRRFLTVWAKERLNPSITHQVGLWTGDRTISCQVQDGNTGLYETRTFTGGVTLDIPDIPEVSDLTIQSIEISVSQNAEIIDLIAREWDLRLARIELHEAAFQPGTPVMAGEPEILFLGVVDKNPITTPAGGSEGSATISIVSSAIMDLQRQNPAKSSYEYQKRRNFDEWGKYSAKVKTWKLPWGREAAENE